MDQNFWHKYTQNMECWILLCVRTITFMLWKRGIRGEQREYIVNRRIPLNVYVWNDANSFFTRVSFSFILNIRILNYLGIQGSEADLEGIAKFLQETILIAFDFIWKVLLSGRKFATLLDPPLSTEQDIQISSLLKKSGNSLNEHFWI